MIQESLLLINAAEWSHPNLQHFHRATSQPILPMAEEYQHLQQHPRMSTTDRDFQVMAQRVSRKKLVDISEPLRSVFYVLGTFVRLLWHHPKMSHDKSRKNQPNQCTFFACTHCQVSQT